MAASYLNRTISTVLVCLLLGASQAAAGETWHIIAEGLSVREIPVNDVGAIVALRIDPRVYRFTLGSASLENKTPKSLSDWCKEKGLHAAINASMYLKDGKTSTGYMRHGKQSHRTRISPRFGAFFVAEPDTDTLPSVDILERDTPNLTEYLRHYTIVVQNYRLFGRDKRILWPMTGKRHAIAAVARATSGTIFFLFSDVPLLPAEFAQRILDAEPDMCCAMYVEGGAQAGLFVPAHSKQQAYTLIPFFEPILPNVLGIQKRTTEEMLGGK